MSLGSGTQSLDLVLESQYQNFITDWLYQDTPNYRKSLSIETVVSRATCKCSSSFTNTNFMTPKNNLKTFLILKDDSRDQESSLENQ